MDHSDKPSTSRACLDGSAESAPTDERSDAANVAQGSGAEAPKEVEQLDSRLEETAKKYNLSSLNVKNIIFHIIKDPKTLAALLEGDADAIENLRLTRSRLKELEAKAHTKLNIELKPVNAKSTRPTLLDVDFPEESDDDVDPDYQPPEENADDTEDRYEFRDFTEEELAAEGVDAGNWFGHDISDQLNTIYDDPDYARFIESCINPGAMPDPFADEDNEEDEDYNPLVQLEASIPEPDEFRNDRSTRIPKRELRRLYNDILPDEPAPKKQHRLSAAGRQRRSSSSRRSLTPSTSAAGRDSRLSVECNINSSQAASNEAHKQPNINAHEANASTINNTSLICDESLDERLFEQAMAETNKRPRDGPQNAPIPKENPTDSTKQPANSSWSLLRRDREPARFTDDEVRALRVQMEKHVQLLTQHIVSTTGIPELIGVRNQALRMMHELDSKMYDNPAEHSIFQIKNLPDAVINCHQIESFDETQYEDLVSKESLLNTGFPHKAALVLAKSEALLYPELLVLTQPAFHPTPLPNFITAEQMLLALALYELHHVPHATGGLGRANFSKYQTIATYFLPNKTANQIRNHVKNVRCGTQTSPLHQLVMHADRGSFNATVELDSGSTKRTEPPMEWPTTAMTPKWLEVIQKVRFAQRPVRLPQIFKAKAESSLMAESLPMTYSIPVAVPSPARVQIAVPVQSPVPVQTPASVVQSPSVVFSLPPTEGEQTPALVQNPATTLHTTATPTGYSIVQLYDGKVQVISPAVVVPPSPFIGGGINNSPLVLVSASGQLFTGGETPTTTTSTINPLNTSSQQRLIGNEERIASSSPLQSAYITTVGTPRSSKPVVTGWASEIMEANQTQKAAEDLRMEAEEEEADCEVNVVDDVDAEADALMRIVDGEGTENPTDKPSSVNEAEEYISRVTQPNGTPTIGVSESNPLANVDEPVNNTAATIPTSTGPPPAECPLPPAAQATTNNLQPSESAKEAQTPSDASKAFAEPAVMEKQENERVSRRLEQMMRCMRGFHDPEVVEMWSSMVLRTVYNLVKQRLFMHDGKFKTFVSVLTNPNKSAADKYDELSRLLCDTQPELADCIAALMDDEDLRVDQAENPERCAYRCALEMMMNIHIYFSGQQNIGTKRRLLKLIKDLNFEERVLREETRKLLAGRHEPLWARLRQYFRGEKYTEKVDMSRAEEVPLQRFNAFSKSFQNSNKRSTTENNLDLHSEFVDLTAAAPPATNQKAEPAGFRPDLRLHNGYLILRRTNGQNIPVNVCPLEEKATSSGGDRTEHAKKLGSIFGPNHDRQLLLGYNETRGNRAKAVEKFVREQRAQFPSDECPFNEENTTQRLTFLLDLLSFINVDGASSNTPSKSECGTSAPS